MFSHVSKNLILAGLLLPTGCGDAGPALPLSLDSVHSEVGMVESAGQDHLVPVRWAYHMTASGTDILICTNSDGSPPFLAIPVQYAAAGRMSHLGRLDPGASGAAFTSCIVNVVGGVPLTAVGTAWVELVGANGDAVFLEGDLTLHFADLTATGEWTVTGGTGRFEGADGWINTRETPAEDGSGSVGTGEGMISPPGVLMR